MKNLTFLLTIHKPKKQEFDYWINFYKKVTKKDFEFHFLIDNPHLEFVFPEWVNDSDIFINKENIGKFKTVYQHINGKNVKSKYFKILDPDDYVSIKNIPLLLEDEYQSGDKIIGFNVTRETGLNNLKQKDVEKFIKKYKENKFYPNFGNSFTILPTKPLEKDSLYSGFDVKTSDDQMLGFLCLANGAEYTRLNSKFYLYNHANGYTNVKNTKNKILNSYDTWKNIETISKKNNVKYIFDFKTTQLPNYHKLYGKFLKNNEKDIQIEEVLKLFEKLEI